MPLQCTRFLSALLCNASVVAPMDLGGMEYAFTLKQSDGIHAHTHPLSRLVSQ